MSESNYWKKYLTQQSLTRRQAIRRLGFVGGGLAALSLVGCGGDDDDDDASGSGGGSTGGSGGGGGSTQPTAAAGVDSTQGIPGGKFVQQTSGFISSIILVTGGAEGVASRTHSSLVQFAYGRKPPEGGSGLSLALEPDLAVALPEQPDDLTYTFKLNPANFQNGTPVTAEDVKYSIERSAFDPETRLARFWVPWLDKVEAPDAETVVVTSKEPYTDVQNVLAVYLRVMSQAHEESADAEKFLMGSGPFIYEDSQPPVIMRFKKNPDYFKKPYPYFDAMDLLGPNDDAKQLADFASGQTHMTYWRGEIERDRIKDARPEATLFQYPYSSMNFFMRADQEPFNDKRVRQAMSMSMDRSRFAEVTTLGEGEPDQALSWIFPDYGTRRPEDLGASAKFFEYNPDEATKLLSAANVTLPIKTDMWHWNSSVVGQAYVDGATFVQSALRELGFVEFEDHETTHPQAIEGWLVGNYSGTCFFIGDGGGFVYNTPASRVQSTFSAPDGQVTPPTDNRPHAINDRLTELAVKQAQTLDSEARKGVFGEMEEIIADEMYVVNYTTQQRNFFIDPKISDNAQVPLWAYGADGAYLKYWWFKES
jgi:peptide/nickel transport system substrate-binding protein